MKKRLALTFYSVLRMPISDMIFCAVKPFRENERKDVFLRAIEVFKN
jgi:hypothetical protein